MRRGILDAYEPEGPRKTTATSGDITLQFEDGVPVGATIRMPNPGLPAIEDRGKPVWVYSCGSTRHGFGYREDAEHITVVSVPIGWALAPDERWGVVLVSTFGHRIKASVVLSLARGGECGFRVRG